MKSNLKWTAILFGLTVSTLTPAQGPPPRGGAGQRPPTPNGQNANRSGSQQSRTSTTASVTSATITLLSRTDVQRDLEITVDQYNQLSQIARSVANQPVSEDSVRASVARVLSTNQATRLTELTIQYLGYGALALTDVRAKLKLTTDQEARVSEILASLAQSKRTVQAAANPSAAQKAISELQSQSNAQLAKVLSSDQDKALRAMAGRFL